MKILGLFVAAFLLTTSAKGASLEYDYLTVDIESIEPTGPWIVLRSWRAANLVDLGTTNADNFSSFLISGPVTNTVDSLTNIRAFRVEFDASMKHGTNTKVAIPPIDGYTNGAKIVVFRTVIDKTQPYMFFNASAEHVWPEDTDFVALKRNSLFYPEPPPTMLASPKVGKLDLAKSMDAATSKKATVTAMTAPARAASIMPPPVKPVLGPALSLRKEMLTKGASTHVKVPKQTFREVKPIRLLKEVKPATKIPKKK